MTSIQFQKPRDDGGPAFPVYFGMTVRKGMSLRDHFAGLAMQGFAADPTSHALFDDPEDMARNAYLVADAMLKAREA